MADLGNSPDGTAHQPDLAAGTGDGAGVDVAGVGEQALVAARDQADIVLATQHQALAEDRHSLERERISLLEEAQNQRAALFGAREARPLAEARLTEAQRLVDQQAEQLADLTRQRDTTQDRCDRLEQELVEVGSRWERQQANAMTEREAKIAHLRATEDRSHAEVDRAHQETKAMTQQLHKLERDRRDTERELRHALEAVRAELVAAQLEVHAQRGRGDTLETQLSRLPAVLEASLTQANSTAQRYGKARPSIREPKTVRKSVRRQASEFPHRGWPRWSGPLMPHCVGRF